MQMALRPCRLEDVHIWNTLTRGIAYLEHYTWNHTAFRTVHPNHAHGVEAMQVRGSAYLHPIPLGELCNGGDVAQYGFGIAATAFSGCCQDVNGLLQTHLHCPTAPLLCCITHSVRAVNSATSFQQPTHEYLLRAAVDANACCGIVIQEDCNAMVAEKDLQALVDRTTLQKCKTLHSIKQLSALLWCKH